MDCCAPSNTPAPQDADTLGEPSSDPPDPACQNMLDFSVNELRSSLTDLLINEDIEISTCGFTSLEKTDVDDSKRHDEPKYSEKKASRDLTLEKCLSKSATSPCICQRKSSAEELLGDQEKEGDDLSPEESVLQAKSANEPISRALSPPTTLKLVSAMKGSREKQGIPPKKLSVKWAPDVYDPVPTSVSHFLSNKNQRHRYESKKHGKSKQKGGGKSSRGSKGKDKKQARKSGGNSNWYKHTKDPSSLIGFPEHQVDIADFDVGSPDPFCGSSFLKKSVTNLHYPVAEAT